MTRARRRALYLACIALLGAAAIGLAALRSPGPRPQPTTGPPRPTLLLLTSLPLLFSEDFGLEGDGSPALAALRSRYNVLPISVADGRELAKGRLLLMAQPQAQTAENLVVLDEWVRRGGRLLLLADPLLEWPSKRPPGDLTRPPAMFPDTGLLAHWNLTLDAPDHRGTADRALAGREILAVSPGTLRGGCVIAADRLVAECKIGKGRVIVVADADFLDVGRLDADAGRNLDGLIAELTWLQRS